MSAARFPILRYIVFISLLIGACASFSATGRVTPSLMLSLAVVWSFVPMLHVVIARAVAGRRGDALLAHHAPWSIWLIATSAMTGTFGFAVYWWMLLAALIPIAITLWIVYRFCIDVMGDAPKRAVQRTFVHQLLTWLVAAFYLERAVSLREKLQAMLS